MSKGIKRSIAPLYAFCRDISPVCDMLCGSIVENIFFCIKITFI